MLTASYIAGGVGVGAFLTARVIRAWRRAGEFINELRADDPWDVPLGEPEITAYEDHAHHVCTEQTCDHEKRPPC